VPGNRACRFKATLRRRQIAHYSMVRDRILD
jgi:hypothetical protein